jgi:hypothetical protein
MSGLFKKEIIFLAFIIVVIPVTECGAQGMEEYYLSDSPTAGILSHGGYMFRGSMGASSSLLFGVSVGFHDRMMVGVTYGIQKFIGRGDMEANDTPGFEVRIRVIEEKFIGPAMAVGLTTQGRGEYIEEEDRYTIKSRGIYAVFSKNYRWIREFSLHGGLNYSLENRDEDGLSLFGGLSLNTIPGLSLVVDYNAALDDNNSDVSTVKTRGRGYLDCGICFDSAETLRIRVLFKDLLGNYKPEKGVERTVEIYYVNYF